MGARFEDAGFVVGAVEGVEVFDVVPALLWCYVGSIDGGGLDGSFG